MNKSYALPCVLWTVIGASLAAMCTGCSDTEFSKELMKAEFNQAYMPGPRMDLIKGANRRMLAAAEEGETADVMMEGQYFVSQVRMLDIKADLQGRYVAILADMMGADKYVRDQINKSIQDPHKIDQMAAAIALHDQFPEAWQALIVERFSQLLGKPATAYASVGDHAELLRAYFADSQTRLVWSEESKSYHAPNVAKPAPGQLLPAGFEPVKGFGLSENGYPKRIICRKDGAEMVYVPAGTLGFKEGRLKVPHFYIDRYETTKARFEAFCKETGTVSQVPAEYTGQHPASNVSFKEAQAYALWCGKSLPTRTQWLRAACGENAGAVWRARPSEDERSEYAVLGRRVGTLSEPLPVGGRIKGASQFGAEDMVGNVDEMTLTKIRGCRLTLGLSYLYSWESVDSVFAKRVASANGFVSGDAKDDQRGTLTGFRCILGMP